MDIFAKFTNLKNKLQSIFSNKILALMIVLIVCVIFIFSFKNSSKKETEQKQIQNSMILDYSSSVENKLESMLIKIDEINDVSVFVAVESTPKIEYLTECEETVETGEKNSTSTKSTTVVFEKNGSANMPIAVTTIMPKVTGILIVTNKISASTKHAIINSVSVVLNIDASCISILQES